MCPLSTERVEDPAVCHVWGKVSEAGTGMVDWLNWLSEVPFTTG